MIKNNVRGSVGVTTHNTGLHACRPHDRRTTRVVRRVDEAWQRLLCLLHPPPEQPADRPLALSLKPRTGGPPGGIVPNDSERSDNAPVSTPTASSSQAPAAFHPTHQSSDTARAGKRRGLSDADVGDAIIAERAAKTVDQSSLPTYRLILIQEPTTGSAFEDNLLGRIGLAPPLILELEVTRNGKLEDPSAELPFLICQCSLLKEDGSVADMLDRSSSSAGSASMLMPPTPKRSRRGRQSSSGRRGSTRSESSTDIHTPSQSAGASSSAASSATPGETSPSLARMLYGTIVAGPQQFPSAGGEGDKPYFFFPEISVRTTGRFRIQCRLMRLALPGVSPSQTGVLASVETPAFEVVKRNDYSAPYITDVSRHFARLGVPLLLPPGVSAE